jgi:hypothetical protein
MNGAEVSVFSKKEESFIGGAQYLHAPIPGVNHYDPDGRIHIWKHGTAEGYAEKVYGDQNAPTSWSNYFDGQIIQAWDLRDTYSRLWKMYEDVVIDQVVTPMMVAEMISDFDLIVSAIPAPAICGLNHTFKKQKVLIAGADNSFPDNTIIWNGDPDAEWYRISKIFGVNGGYELPLGSIVAGAKLIRKPLSTDCDCFPEILRVGRYGRWEKDALTHHAVELVKDRIYALL